MVCVLIVRYNNSRCSLGRRDVRVATVHYHQVDGNGGHDYQEDASDTHSQPHQNSSWRYHRPRSSTRVLRQAFSQKAKGHRHEASHVDVYMCGRTVRSRAPVSSFNAKVCFYTNFECTFFCCELASQILINFVTLGCFLGAYQDNIQLQSSAIT